MKRNFKRALSLLLTLAMCMGLLPVNVLAGSVTTVTIDASSATLTGGDSPTATLSWSLSPALSSTEGIMTEVYAWAGSSTTRPDKRWFMTVGGNQTDTQTTTGGSFNGYLAADTGAEKLSGACMMQVELVDWENNPIATSTAVAVTVAAPTPPTVQEVAFYHQYAPIGSGDEGTGAWYHFKGGSSNLEAFALSQADSEESAYNSSYQMKGFKVDDQWYKVEAFYTVGSNVHDLMVKDNGEMVVNAVPLSFAIAPEEGDKLWLALWDYNASALSNVVEITVPAVNSTTGEIAATLTPTLSIGTASFPDATVGQAYTATLSGSAANGGALSWSVSSGALPAGLTLSGGTISGTPTTVGSSTFELTLTEAGNGSVKKQFTFKVSSLKPRINVSMPADSLVKGRAYTIPLKGAASGGGTLSWSVSSGSLPTGMSLAPSTGADAAISGTPTATGTFRFTLTLTETATDTTTTAAEQQCTLTVREPASYNITFLTNGGSSVESTTVAESVDGTTTFTLPAAPTKRGSNFGGWYSSADYKTHDAGETVMIARDTRFSAQWTDKDAVTATYTGAVVGNVYLYGKLDGGEKVWLDSSWSSEVRGSVALTVSPWQLSGYALTGLSLEAYVDGSYTEIASYTGDPDALANGATVALTQVGTVKLATGAVVSNGGLTAGADYGKPRSAYNTGLGWSLSFPFLTTGTGYKMRFYDAYTDLSKGYIWDKDYDLTLGEDGIFHATIDPFEPDATLTGTIKDGADQGVQGAVVSVSQYVHGHSWSDTAVTGASGAYSLRCFHGDGVAARVSVVNDGMTAYNESNVAISDADAVKNITLNKVTAAVRVDLDTASMSDAAKNELLSRYECRPTVCFYDKAATDPTRKLLASEAVAFGQTAYVTVPNQVESATLYWTVSGDYVQSASGSVTFADSKATVTQTVQPTPAVMLTLTALSYGAYDLIWFDGSGAAKGSQSVTLYKSSPRTLLLPFPGDAGTYTLAVTPDYGAAGSLAAIPGDMLLKKWEGLTRQAEIQVLDSCTLTAAQMENAAYVTKPNSTLTAGADSFSSASELVRFTGTVGLDDGMTGGKLTSLHLDPRNPVQSYSNSATLVCAVVGGKVYQDGWTVNAVSEYTLDLGAGVDLPCDYTLYCRPGSIDWDMMLTLDADVTSNNISYSDQLVGSATVAKPGASISTASLTVCSDEISVKGVAKPNEAVAIYDSGTPVGTAKADYRGAWSARVPLYGTQAGLRTRHGVYAVTDSGTVSNELLILHDANAPELTSFRMAWEKYDYAQEIEMGDSYTFVGHMKDVTFRAAFKNPGALAAMESWDNAKVVFEYELTSGETGTVKATGPDADGVFTATVPGYLTSSVTGARPIFRAAAPDNAAQYLETAANGGTVLMSQASKTALDALTGENDVNLAGTIRHELTGAAAGDSYTVTFDGGTASLEGTQLGVTATPADIENGNTRIPTKAEAQANMQAAYTSLAAAGVEMHSVSETYGDETTTVAWLQNEGVVWAGLLPNATAEANKLSVFTAQFDLQTIDPVRYERERALLAQYADIHNSVYDVGSAATANVVVDSYFFTDAEPDENGELGRGTYLASVRVLGDRRDGAYLVEAVLWMSGKFTGFEGALKNPVPVAAALVRNDPDPPNIVPEVTVKTSACDGLSFVEGASGNLGLEATVDQFAFESTKVARTEMNAFNAAKNLVDNGTNASNLVRYKAAEQLAAEKAYLNNFLAKGAATLALINLISSSINFFSGDSWEKQYDHVKSLMDSKTGERMKRLDPIGYQGLQDSLDAVRSFGKNSNEWAWGSYLTGNAGNAAGTTGLFSSFISTCSGALIGVGSFVFGSIFSDQAATQASLRDVMYTDCLERFSEWLCKDALVNHDPDAIDMYKQFTGKSRAIPLNDGANRQYTQSTVYNKVSNDPSGVVFEGVIENPVENANVTLWYAVNAGGGLEKIAGDVSSIVPADGVDGMIPASAEQVTGADGRYQWFVPEGLWYVTAESGTRKGSSDNDTAANQSVTVSTGPKGNTSQTYKLLPVLPVQLDVNIPLVDPAAPVVTAEQYTTDGVFVTFSKYMDESTLISANFRIAVDGGEAKNAANVEFVESGSTPANLGEVKHYTRAVKLTPADNIQAGSNITLTVMSGVKSYADTPFGADYVSGGVIVAPEKLGMPTWAVDGVAKTGATITVTNGSGLTIRLPDGAPAGAKVLYSTDGGSTWKEYSGVIVLNKNMVIRAKATAVGYTDSDVLSASFVLEDSPNNSGNNNTNSTSGGSGGGAATSGDKTGVGSIETTAKVSGGKAQASVSASSAAAALKNAKAGDTLTVKVDTGKADDVSVTLPAKTVQTVADAKADVRLETGRGTVTLDADTVAELAKAGADAAVSVTKNADGTTTVAVTSGGKNVDARLKVALPAAAGGETLMLVNADGSTTPVKKSIVENGVVYAEIPAGATVKVASAAKSFPDVPADAWYAKSVKFVTSHGLFQGTDMGFEPDATMTRAMLATVLYRLEDGRSVGKNRFTDVPDGQWFTEAVIWADSAGIVNGTAGTQFSPDEPVTREQIATMLYRYAKAIGLDTTGRAELNGFSDGGKTASWASEAMQWAVSAGLFKGDANGALNPGGKATRAEVATLLERMVALMVKYK